MSSKEDLRREAQRRYDLEHNQAERNEKGQFATPAALARQIVTDAIGRVSNPQSFLEPSCGTGAFISAVRELCPAISIEGIEKDPSVFEIADGIWSDDCTKIINGDFFELFKDSNKYDLLITNPPYTRHHHLSAQVKALCGSVVEESTGMRLSQLAGLHAYFILAATSLLNEGGIASWLIPSELFSVNYGRIVCRYVTSDVSVERIHFFEECDLQFDDALVSSCVLVLRKKKADDGDLVFVSKGNFESPEKKTQRPIRELRNIKKWQHIFEMEDVDCDSRIGDYFTVKRGLSTGAESFYARSREEWHRMGVDDTWLLPVLPAPRYMKEELVESDELGWPLDHDRALLSIPTTTEEAELPGSVMLYLETCPEKIRNSYTLRHRKKWYSIERRDPAPIVCTYMSRSDSQPFRFIRNKSSAVATTAYLCLYPKDHMTDDQLDVICEKLNAIPPSALIKSGREYGGGLRKLEPRELSSVPFSAR